MDPPWRGRGRSFNKGRGRNSERIIGQIGHRRLIASNIANTASSSSGNTGNVHDDPEYQEFLAYKASKGKDNIPSYANALNNEESDEGSYDQNPYKEIILLLDNKDLKYKDYPWTLMERFFDTGSYPAGVYKSRFVYEQILRATESAQINHFKSPSNDKVYNFSKIIIKRIISLEDWGTSPLKEKEMKHPDTNAFIKFNYWDYMEAFNKCFLYQNPSKKHSWFFKICPQVYNSDIPNWFYKWWINYGSSIKILPETFKDFYNEWVEISPKMIEAQHHNELIEGMPSLHFFMEFGIPWIWKWSPEVGYTNQHIPCLRRIFFTKFWKKMIHKNKEGIIEGQETIDQIKSTLELYRQQIQMQSQRESPSPFQIMARRITIKDGNNELSKQQFIEKYLEEAKRDLIKNLQKASKSPKISQYSSNDEEDFMAGESQSMEDEDMDDVTIEAMIEKISNEVTQPLNNSQMDKMKGPTIRLIEDQQ